MIARNKARDTRKTTLRHVWLASLGAIVVARREVRGVAETAVEEAGKLRERAIRFAGDVRAVARGGLLTVGEQIEPRLGPLSAGVEARLAPVLVKLGLKPQGRKPARQGRKTVTKRTVRRAARQPVARAVRKARA
jgi:hypothetical protein